MKSHAGLYDFSTLHIKSRPETIHGRRALTLWREIPLTIHSVTRKLKVWQCWNTALHCLLLTQYVVWPVVSPLHIQPIYLWNISVSLVKVFCLSGAMLESCWAFEAPIMLGNHSKSLQELLLNLLKCSQSVGQRVEEFRGLVTASVTEMCKALQVSKLKSTRYTDDTSS